MLRIETIRNLNDFVSLREEWKRLQLRLGSTCIFLGYEWFRVCASNLRPGQELLILMLWEGNLLVGIAPLMRTERRIRRLPLKRIEFLGNEITPIADFLLVEVEKSLRAIVDYLYSTEKRWDVLWLAGLSKNSAALEALSSGLCAPARQQVQRKLISSIPYLQINSSWDEFYNAKSRKFRMTRRSITNRIHRMEGIEIEHITGASAADGLASLLEVSSRSWKRRENLDLIDAAFEKKFFSELTEVAAERGWVHIWLLKQKGRPIAAEYHLQSGDVVYGLRAHYDDEYAQCSPGAYLDLEVVKQLHENGVRCYDMGPGTAEYKLAWTDSSYPLFAVELYNQSMYARFVSGFENSFIPAVKRTALGRHLQRFSGKEA
jgi:CelD/BcsL family acetyltransferase involved in cellulose biosynthesis